MAERPDDMESSTERRGPSLGLLPLSRAHLDDLLRELLERVGEVMQARERMRALLDAVVAVGSGLELRATLQRLVEAACELTDARYGALGVIGPDDTLSDFITHGLDDAERAAIGDLPRGHGVLGMLIEDPRVTRLSDITAHPRSYGFPPEHPPMRTFLGAPIQVRDRVFGNIYLTDKRGGTFTAHDEELTAALSAAAGVAIDNVELYEQADRRRRWLEAAAEITEALLGEVSRTSALRLIAQRAREVADADAVLVLLLAENACELTIEVAEGNVPAALHGIRVPVDESAFDSVVNQRRFATVAHLDQAAAWDAPVPHGPGLIVPLAAGDHILGALAVAHRSGGLRAFDDGDVGLVESFAAQAALALERARAKEEQELLAVLGDRERIARDLHDLVIQRLFAIGLQLQAAGRLTVHIELGTRINDAVDNIDATIRDIRGAIFELRTPSRSDVRAQLRELVDDATGTLGYRPRLWLDGPIDSAVTDDLRADLLAVLREALSNVARHARAGAVDISIRVASGVLRLTIVDDGVGIPEPRTGGGYGLTNIAERATTRGGTFTVEPAKPRGTRLTWAVLY